MREFLNKLFGWLLGPIGGFQDELDRGNTPSVAAANQAEYDGSDAISSLVNKYTGAGLTGEQEAMNEFQHREAEIAYQRQIDFYNNYQSPQAMVSQYASAGLNPALMYNGGTGAVSAPSVPQASGNASQNSADLISLIAGFIFRNKELALEKQRVDADVALKRSQADEATARAEGYRTDNKYRDEYNQLRNLDMSQAIELKKSQAKSNEAKAALDVMQEAILGIDKDFRERLNQMRLDIMDLQKEAQDMSNQEAKFDLLHYEQTYLINMRRVIADTALANAHAEQIREYCRIMMKEGVYLDEEGKKTISRLAQMTDEEITNLRKNNKAKWSTQYVGPLAGGLAGLALGTAGLLKAMSPSRVVKTLMLTPFTESNLNTGLPNLPTNF